MSDFFVDVGFEYVPSDQDECSGLIERDYREDPLGGDGFSAPLEKRILTRQEIKERIEYRNKTQTNIDEVAARAGWSPDHQARTNWCAANTATMAMSLKLILQGQTEPLVKLSNTSLAMPVVGGNFGGYPTAYMKYAARHGAADQSVCKPNVVGARVNTPEIVANRQKYIVQRFIDLDPRAGIIEQIATVILDETEPSPVGIAYGRIRHAVTAVRLVLNKDGSFSLKCANSGLMRGPDGYTTFSERWSVPNEAVAPALIIAS